MTRGSQVSQVFQQTCQECKNPFLNNGRNAQEDKRFCCSACASINGNREWRKRKIETKEHHPLNCMCSFCKINRAVSSKIFYIIHQDKIMNKVFHSGRWS